MKVDKLTLDRVFDRTERFEAPLFQRPYVWNEEDNWAPLWESIKMLTEKRIAGIPSRPHFLGTIVVDQLKTSIGKTNARQIIDGQQRLTTLQLALAAIRDLCEKCNEPKYAKAFEKLTTNDVPLSTEPDDVFKVWPTNADRDAFRFVMKAKSATAVRKQVPDEERRIPRGYLYFSETFDEWLGPYGTEEFKKRLEGLYAAMRDDLHLVVIDLEEQDDAQEIFETLNALGTPLLPADLVKNFLFHLAQEEKEDIGKLYERFWSPFDCEVDYWRKEIRQGRLKRPRLDLFLTHFLTLKLGREVLIAQLFNDYRNFVDAEKKPASFHLELFRAYADVYKQFDQFPEYSREGVFFYRLDQLDTTTVFPLLLEVLKRHTPDSRADLDRTLGALESFLVRRLICDLTPKNYNKLFVELVKELSGKNDFSSLAIKAFLLRQTTETSRWPMDEEFKNAWFRIQFYKRLKQAKGRMLLEVLEASLHSGKTEKVRVERKLTIEHLLPRNWKENWPLKVTHGTPEYEKLAEERNGALETVGNLTLLTKQLNPSVSNGPWDRKRKEILKHSALNLNRTLSETWDEDHIKKRTEELFRAALKVWPHGDNP